jgi:hypothetical protein
MVGAVGVATLQNLIRQDQAQLNDWTTCVSAKTPKGQSEIQKYSADISADKEQIARAQQAQAQAQSRTPSPASTTSASVDVWV